MTSSSILLRHVFNCTYPFSKITNILTSPLTSSEQCLKPIWEAVSWAIFLSKFLNETETRSFMLCIFISVDKFRQLWRDLEQTSLLCLNSTRYQQALSPIWLLGKSRWTWMSLPWFSDLPTIVHDLVWWCNTSTWLPSWKILGEPSWKTLGENASQLKKILREPGWNTLGFAQLKHNERSGLGWLGGRLA